MFGDEGPSFRVSGRQGREENPRHSRSLPRQCSGFRVQGLGCGVEGLVVHLRLLVLAMVRELCRILAVLHVRGVGLRV